MQRVTGIGGIFFKSPDPKRLGAWYREHLGLDVTDWGGVAFQWGGPDSPPGMTLWSPFAADTAYMAPSTAPFMVNFRVADLEALPGLHLALLERLLAQPLRDPQAAG